MKRSDSSSNSQMRDAPASARAFGELMKSVRTRRGQSQAALAEAAHTSQQTIHRIEVGRADPPLSVALRISQVLGFDLLVRAYAAIELEKNDPA